jgi:hypothetical protein
MESIFKIVRLLISSVLMGSAVSRYIHKRVKFGILTGLTTDIRFPTCDAVQPGINLQWFGGTYYLQLERALKLEGASCFEQLAKLYQTAWRHAQEDSNLQYYIFNYNYLISKNHK